MNTLEQICFTLLMVACIYVISWCFMDVVDTKRKGVLLNSRGDNIFLNFIMTLLVLFAFGFAYMGFHHWAVLVWDYLFPPFIDNFYDSLRGINA